MHAHERAEARLRPLLATLEGKLGADDSRSVKELIDHNECVIALENMCTQLHEFDAELSSTELKEIQAVANLLNVDVTYRSA